MILACSAASNIGVSQKKKGNTGDREMELGRCFAACFIRNELQSGVKQKKIRSQQFRLARKEHSQVGMFLLQSKRKGTLLVLIEVVSVANGLFAANASTAGNLQGSTIYDGGPPRSCHVERSQWLEGVE
jgi:hypothetical protein